MTIQAQNLELRLEVAKLKKQIVDQQIKLIASQAQLQIVSLDPTLRQLDAEIASLEASRTEIVSSSQD